MTGEDFKGLPREFEVTVTSKHVKNIPYECGQSIVRLEATFGEGWVDRSIPNRVRPVENNGTAIITLDFNSYSEGDKIAFGQKFRVSIVPVEEATSELFPDEFFEAEGDPADPIAEPVATSGEQELRDLMEVVQLSLGENTVALEKLITTLQTLQNLQTNLS